MIRSIYISVPAWGDLYIELAVNFTIPAIQASLLESKFTDIHFIVHTDKPVAFEQVLFSWQTQYVPISLAPLPNRGRLNRIPDVHWVAFKQAHKDVLNMTPEGAIAVLLNSDVVVSRETFSVVNNAIEDGKKAVVSVGIRTSVEQNDGGPPIGANANELFKWIWKHRHHITDQCIWGSGGSRHPTILFFDDGKNVSMHGFHLTPMFVLKDREFMFRGTIDDDLLQNYSDDEIQYLTNGEAAFCEMSSDAKAHPFSEVPLTVDAVFDFGKRRFRPAHIRNFKQRMRVLGNPTVNHLAANEIIARFS
jgi:hypothetical protein